MSGVAVRVLSDPGLCAKVSKHGATIQASSNVPVVVRRCPSSRVGRFWNVSLDKAWSSNLVRAAGLLVAGSCALSMELATRTVWANDVVNSYPIHSSMGGRFGGLHIKGEARNFNRSSTE